MRHAGNSQNRNGFDLALIDLLPVLWQRRGTVALVFAAVLVMAALIIPRWVPTYHSVAEIGFVTDGDDAPLDGIGIAQHLETRMAELRGNEVLATALSVLRGDGVEIASEGAKREGDEDRAIGILRSRIDVARIGNASVIEVRASDADPLQSQKILSAVIDSYLWQRENARKQGLRARLSETSDQ